MDLNVAVLPANELFDDNDMVFPILMGRDNLKILASPGSESSGSSGVSSLDAEEAKKLANEQLPTSNSPTLASEPSSAVQTESESSDGSSSDGSSSDGSDDDKPIEKSSSDNVQTTDESEQQSSTSDDDDKDDVSVCNEQINENDVTNGTDLMIDELVSNVTVAAQKTNDDKVSAIDLDEIRYKNLKIFYEGRDILDFSKNVANKSWNVEYAHLPEQNYQMYIQNRSQYNRLAPGYESPEHYTLNTCVICAFQSPVMVDIPDENDPIAANVCKSTVNDLLSQTVATTVSSLAQKLPVAQPMIQPPMHTPTGHSMNNNMNNYMFNNNNAANTAQSYAYQNQNRNQFAGNANAISAAAAAAAAAANNHNSFKPNNNNSNGNAFYGNNMVLNALVNQIGNNMNNSSVFNSNFMNAINGTNNTTANNNNNNNTTVNQLNQLSNAALANLMNQQNQRQQLYGMCRQNINKSGINFNANSHKQMPTYSHF